MHEIFDLKVNTYKAELEPQQLLNVIFGYMGKIANTRNLDHLLIAMADMGREMIVADRCTLWLIDEDTGELWSKVAHGVDRIRIPFKSGFAGHVIMDNKPILVDDAYQDPRFNRDVDKRTGYRTKAVLCIPIENGEGKTIGVYQAINKMTPEGRFLPKDIEYLSLAASYSGKALEAAQLNYEIEQTQKEIIYVMGEIGESRSKETGNHVKRVAEYSKLLACKMGLSQSEAELIKMASPMHDIGKVGIPDSILMKPGKLTVEEFSLMKTHTEVGYNLLKSSQRKIIRTAAIISQQHHEKWNGSGYPLGLKEEEIHIYGRITAVADVFDALASDRCYKKAWDLDRVINLFKEERGRQFDPHLVDVLLENIDEILLIRNKYADLFG